MALVVLARFHSFSIWRQARDLCALDADFHALGDLQPDGFFLQIDDPPDQAAVRHHLIVFLQILDQSLLLRGFFCLRTNQHKVEDAKEHRQWDDRREQNLLAAAGGGCAAGLRPCDTFKPHQVSALSLSSARWIRSVKTREYSA